MIGPAVHAVAAIQVAEIMKIAIGEFDSLNTDLLAVDVWELSFDRVPLDAPRPDCPTCRLHRYDFLDRARPSQSTVLCGHDAIQVLPDPPTKLDLNTLAQRLNPLGEVMPEQFLIRFEDPVTQNQITVFPDGRAIIKGTTDESEARSLYARFIGN